VEGGIISEKEFIMYNMNRQNIRGFTLVELLVVISIIALLLAVLIPALSSARQQATTVTCATRLKDIGVVFGLYMADNNGNLPTNRYVNVNDGYDRWCALIAKYYNRNRNELKDKNKTPYAEICRCPAQNQKFSIENSAYGIYGFNPWLSFANTTYQYRYNQIKIRSEIALLCCLNGDSYNGLGGGGGLGMGLNGPHPLAYKYGYRGGKPKLGDHWDIFGPAPNHRGKCNFLFADFHVEGRNVCKESAWPWLGRWDGWAFHPTGKR
jgi:prepilin-type N-terminal cleavage/methylation domain-containing protein/prepilin-type processing-associated H-X9-DG protein